MIKSKAIDIISSLDKKEFNEFGKFVNSPYFNSNSKLSEIYDVLKIHYPGFSKRSFTKENIYQKLFPGKKYNDGTVRKLFSGLHILAENFLSHNALRKNYNFNRDFFLLESLAEKKLDKLYKLHTIELNKIYRQNGNFEDDYFFNNFLLEVSNLNFNLGSGRGGFDQKINLNSLLKCSVYIICYSLIVILKLNQDIIVRRVGYDFDYENTITNKFVESISSSSFLEQIKNFAPNYYPVILIYFHRIQIASGKDNDDMFYFEMKKHIMNNIDYFTRFEKYNLVLFLENSCDEKIKNGKKFQEELFNVHNYMLSKELFTYVESDYLSLIGFRKIIRNALSLNKFGWATSFIEKFINKLPAEFRENMKNYSMALLNFRQGYFDIALKDLSKVKFEVYSIKFDTWTLKLQIEFELKYFEEAVYSIDSYKHSLKSDTSSPAWVKERFMKFLNLYQKLIKVSNIESEDRGFLEKEISGSQNLIESDWLLEKVNEN